MNDHDTDRRLRSWVRSASDPSAPADLRRKVIGIPDAETAKQRRRRPWLLPGREPTAGADDRGAGSRPITTDHGNGGTRSMFSATKLIAIAASVALFGALALALPLGQQQDVLPPAAEAPAPGEITPFTAEMRILGQDDPGISEQFDWGTSSTGEQWTIRFTATDPRYSGVSTGFHNYNEIGPGEGFIRVHKSRLFTRDDDGRWLTTAHGYQGPEPSGITFVAHSIGEGTYEGLSAMVTCEQTADSAKWACDGIIFEGEWPELPAEAPEEIPAIHLAP